MHPAPAIKFFTLYLQSVEGFEGGKSLVQMGQSKGTAVVTPLSGVGDDAYYASFGSTVTSLMVRKGAAAFKLTLYGATAPDKAMAIEKTLALLVVPQL